MRLFLLLSSVFLYTTTLFCQQLPHRSHFSAFDFAWNPALTANEEYSELSLGHWQEWSGVNDAPRTNVIAYQQALPKQNISLGGVFFNDNAGPITTNSLAISYAYHLRKNRRSKQQLTLALMGSIQHLLVDGSNLVVTTLDDGHLPSTENNTIAPNVGMGVYYRSDISGDFDKKYMFAGIGSNQLLPRHVVFDAPGSSDADFQRSVNANATVGIHIPFQNIFFIRPSLWANFSSPNIQDIQLRIALEKYNSFWINTHLSLNQILAFQLGTSINKGPVTKGSLRIGVQGGFFLGTLGSAVSPGYSLYLGYRM